MMSSLRPSCLRVSAREAKRGSVEISRWTKERRSVREVRKDAVLPITVADATMNQLCSNN